MACSIDDAADVGQDDGTPVTEDYMVMDNHFTGTIQKVTVALQPAKPNTQSTDEEAKKIAVFKKAMAD